MGADKLATQVAQAAGSGDPFIYLFSVSTIAIITGLVMNTFFKIDISTMVHQHENFGPISGYFMTALFIIIIFNIGIFI